MILYITRLSKHSPLTNTCVKSTVVQTDNDGLRGSWRQCQGNLFTLRKIIMYHTSSSFILDATRDMCFRGMWTRLPHQRCIPHHLLQFALHTLVCFDRKNRRYQHIWTYL